MKNNLYALRRTMLLVCLALLCFCQSSYAQQPNYYSPMYDLSSPMPAGTELDTTFHHRMRHIFGLLETNRVPKGILLDYAMEFTNMSNYNGNVLADTNYVDQAAYWEIYRTLHTARIHTSAAALDLNNLDSEWYSNRQPGRITLAGMYFQYARFRDDAVSSNRLTVSNDQLLDKYVSGTWQNPYQTERVFAVAPATRVYEGLSQQILLPTALWESNESGSVSSLQVDAGDGLGYRIMSIGQALSVVYPDTGRKEIKYKLNLSNGTSMVSHSEIEIRPVDDDIPAGPPPTPGISNCPCLLTASESFGGQFAQGYVRIRYADGNTDNVLRNPLIVVEGFDPSHILKPESTYGNDLAESFEEKLRESGNLRNLLNGTYDVVYVDWKNGTDDIRRNAMLVKEVIRRVNNQKIEINGTKSPTVIIGVSMGGLAVRWALKDMEDKKEIHDIRLFVSFDTPHQGATVPIGYQHLVRHVKGLYIKTGPTASNTEAIQFFRGGMSPHRALSLADRPASMQMLINRINDNGEIDNTVHDLWQTELRAKGYPVGDKGPDGNINPNFRKVAVSNGAECGSFQAYNPGALIFSLSGQGNTRFLGDLAGQLTFPIASIGSGQPLLLMGFLPGRNEFNIDIKVNAIANNGGNRVFYSRIKYVKEGFYLAPVNTYLSDISRSAPSGLLPYDTFGGGFYETDIETRHYTSQSENDFVQALVKYDITLFHQNTFNYIPTTSALDIGGGYEPITYADHTAQYIGSAPPVGAKSSPFDNFTTAFEDARVNERHTFLNPRSGNWIAAEINSTPALAPDCTFICGVDPITGPAVLCSSSTYALPNVPAGTTVQWFAAPDNMFTTSSGFGSSVYLEPVYGATGIATITFRIFGECRVDITKEIQVGSSIPEISAAYDPYCNCSVQGDLSTGKAYDFYMFTDNPSTFTGDYTWVVIPPMDAQNPFPMMFDGKKLTFTAMEPGYYTLQARQNYECGWSQFSEKTFYFTGETIDNYMVEVYPNPASDELNATMMESSYAESTEGEEYQVVLYNSQQKVVYETKSRSKDLKIPVNELREGIYYLKFIFRDAVTTKRIQISRRK